MSVFISDRPIGRALYAPFRPGVATPVHDAPVADPPSCGLAEAREVHRHPCHERWTDRTGFDVDSPRAVLTRLVKCCQLVELDLLCPIAHAAHGCGEDGQIVVRAAITQDTGMDRGSMDRTQDTGRTKAFGSCNTIHLSEQSPPREPAVATCGLR